MIPLYSDGFLADAVDGFLGAQRFATEHFQTHFSFLPAEKQMTFAHTLRLFWDSTDHDEKITNSFLEENGKRIDNFRKTINEASPLMILMGAVQLVDFYHALADVCGLVSGKTSKHSEMVVKVLGYGARVASFVEEARKLNIAPAVKILQSVTSPSDVLHGGNPRVKELVADFPNAVISHIFKAFTNLMTTNSDAELMVTFAKLDIALDCKPASRSASDSHEQDIFFHRATIHRECRGDCEGACYDTVEPRGTSRHADDTIDDFFGAAPTAGHTSRFDFKTFFGGKAAPSRIDSFEDSGAAGGAGVSETNLTSHMSELLGKRKRQEEAPGPAQRLKRTDSTAIIDRGLMAVSDTAFGDVSRFMPEPAPADRTIFYSIHIGGEVLSELFDDFDSAYDSCLKRKDVSHSGLTTPSRCRVKQPIIDCEESVDLLTYIFANRLVIGSTIDHKTITFVVHMFKYD